MSIQDLDYFTSVSHHVTSDRPKVAQSILGGAYATVGGYTTATYGSGSAQVYALAAGTGTQTYGNTYVSATIAPGYGMTQSTGVADAWAIDANNSSQATFLSNTSFSQSMGGSMTSNFTTGQTSYRSRTP
jgi:GH24 family phage-related lysozyme (muramidase)